MDCIASGAWKLFPAPYSLVVGTVEHQRALRQLLTQQGQERFTWVPASWRFVRSGNRLAVRWNGLEVGWVRPEVARAVLPLMEAAEQVEFEELGVVQMRRLANGQPVYVCHVWPYNGPLIAYESIEQHRALDWAFARAS